MSYWRLGSKLINLTFNHCGEREEKNEQQFKDQIGHFWNIFDLIDISLNFKSVDGILLNITNMKKIWNHNPNNKWFPYKENVKQSWGKRNPSVHTNCPSWHN